MKKIKSINGNAFITNKYDDSSSVWTGDYVWLFCTETVTKNSVSFEYPSILFKGLNLIRQTNVLSVENTTPEEERIFNKIKRSIPLDKEDKLYLKENYLKVISHK